MFEFITKRSFFINVLAAIVLIVVLGAIFFATLGIITHHGKTITVPDIRGKNVKEATEILGKAGFEATVRDSIYADTIPALSVYDQAPEGGAVEKVGRTVYLTINKTIAPMVQMPELVGLTFRSAQMTLESRRLKVGDTSYQPDFATNTVLKQVLGGKPVKAGTEVPEGSAISLVLSSGTGNTENPVPDLTGLSFAEARDALTASNLGIGTVLTMGEISDTAAAFVVRQSPTRVNAQGDINTVRAGETIDLWLSAVKPSADSVHP
ncbi:PASTA domain, binds beta-lactams [Chitinophaga costaii]|uniref:PASTA domain, binds beta-lactams n=1 Tax=Chitinophaga costaii TaxID=1335309 RepID=A0A1C4ES08_9BACT|nr:PASTA domain-containing protein [Chitinophaga costaii]PUZ22553.1 PASTA domain-containing protein [Chitinophaga costaii]SCC46356.1 PASTA domain, binds beta-lactams [Chitinophaga costaii]